MIRFLLTCLLFCTAATATTPQNPSHTVTIDASDLQSQFIEAPTQPSEPRLGRNIQLTLNTMAWVLAHLEVLNIYNCERWWCGGAPALYLGLSAINYAALFREHKVMIPTLVTAAVGAGSLFFWDVEYWNIFTRHRTEYYDTHNFYDNALWLNQFWALVFLFVIKKHQNQNSQEPLSDTEVQEVRQLLRENLHNLSGSQLLPEP